MAGLNMVTSCGSRQKVLKTASNGTASFKKVNNCWNTNIHSFLETSGGQNSTLYLNVVHFFQHQY
jgi:hypothetical protein